MPYEITRRFGVVHAIAECETCGWRTDNYKNAQANAARHAKAHGHKVVVEVGTVGTYEPA